MLLSTVQASDLTLNALPATGVTIIDDSDWGVGSPGLGRSVYLGLLFTRTGCSRPSGQELIGAAMQGDAAAVQTLLDAGADVNAEDNMEGRTALLWAASNGHADTVQVLLGAGANVDAQVKDNDEDKEGRTALILAAVGGHTAILRAVLFFEEPMGMAKLLWALDAKAKKQVVSPIGI